MFYPDLTSIQAPLTRVPVVCIGWMSAAYAIPQASIAPSIPARLWAFTSVPVNQMRGFHVCELCPDGSPGQWSIEHDGVRRWLGSAEIRVFGQDGTIYAAPDLIYHYVVDHQYRPPDAFIDALLHGPQPGTAAYQSLLVRYGWD